MLAYSTTTYSREDAIASRLKIAMRMLCYGGAVDGLSCLLGQYAACIAYDMSKGAVCSIIVSRHALVGASHTF